MARAELELDDPLKSREGAETSNSADDLLAQLAGDEVDRMLSEADAAAPEPQNTDRPVAESAAVSAANAADPVLEAAETALDGLDAAPAATAKSEPAKKSRGRSKKTKAGAAAGAVTGSPPPADAAAAVPSAPASRQQTIEEMISQRADDLIAQARLDTDGEVAAGVVPDPPSAADALSAEMEEDERAHFEALKRMKSGASADAAGPAPAQFVPAPHDADEPLELDPMPGQEAGPTVIDEAQIEFSKPDKVPAAVPLLVRVLEWINAPLAGLSDGVRTAIGKIAIVTTFNAVGVLLYVLIFRRHH